MNISFIFMFVFMYHRDLCIPSFLDNLNLKLCAHFESLDVNIFIFCLQDKGGYTGNDKQDRRTEDGKFV